MHRKTDIVQAWRQRPRQLSGAEDVVRRTAFDILQRGHAAACEQLLTATGLTPSALEDAIASLLQQGLIECDGATGTIVGSFGLTLRVTPHRLGLNGLALYTWCALDAVGIPAALGAEAEVCSHCPTCSKAITLSARAGKYCPEHAADLRIWLTLPRRDVSAVGET